MERMFQTLQQTIQLIFWQVFDLVSAVADLLWTSSVALPVLAFVGIILVAFLLGLFLGRLSKHRVSEVSKFSKEGEADRIPLDLEKLRPLGLSAEEEVEVEVMDISSMEPDESIERTARIDRWDRLGPGAASQR
jgi:hypothetical protein